jgi:hypothetical protein
MPKLRHTWLIATILFATAVSSAPAKADDSDSETAYENRSKLAKERPENGYWSVGDPRFFVSTKTELGIPYTKPYFSAGYGLPHWIWTGFDVNAILTTDCFQAYGGVRAATPVLDFAFGVRDTWSFNKPYLTPSESFTGSDVTNAPGDQARYWAYEAEVVGIVPFPYAALAGDFIAVGALDVPKGVYWYDESYRVVAADSQFFVMRVAAVARFLHEQSLKVGVLTEHIFGTGRGDPVTRVGPFVSLQLTDHLEVNAVLTLVVSSPDHLGLIHGTYGVAGVRYRWATGERDPKKPWEGMIIP